MLTPLEQIAQEFKAQDERTLIVVLRDLPIMAAARTGIIGSMGDAGLNGYYDGDGFQSYFGPGQVPGVKPVNPR